MCWNHEQTRVFSPPAGKASTTDIDLTLERITIDAAGFFPKRSTIVFAPLEACYHGFLPKAIFACPLGVAQTESLAIEWMLKCSSPGDIIW